MNARVHTFGAVVSPVRTWGDAVRTAWQTVTLWRERARSREALARLDEHLLRDIGLTRYDVERESTKPFWVG